MSSLAADSQPHGPDALIVVPPFSPLQQPALGPHLLQAVALERRFDVRVIYASLAFAARIGIARYRTLGCQPSELLGERIFAAAAFGSPPLGRRTIDDDVRLCRALRDPQTLDLQSLKRMEFEARLWISEFSAHLASLGASVIGFSTSYEQTAASVALSHGVKSRNSKILTVLGGANCEGEMGEELLRCFESVDFVCSGEGEEVFVHLLEAVRAARPLSRSVLRSRRPQILDDLPCPNFSDYFEQLETLRMKDIGSVWLPYESSRGCWWGERHHCTFCGLNGELLAFRAKSPDTVLRDLATFADRYEHRNVCMTDNIMPHQYIRTVIPRLPTLPHRMCIFYEVKANLSFADLRAMRDGGIVMIQPGIESLSTAILRRLRKGVTAWQNIDLLRFARSLGISVEWNLLYGIPGDRAEEYATQLRIVPALIHLQPPRAVGRIVVDRFSPYFTRPDDFGIEAITAYASYSSVYPDDVNVDRLAYHFRGTYRSESLDSPKIVDSIKTVFGAWQAAWSEGAERQPSLELVRHHSGTVAVLDGRRRESAPLETVVSSELARALLDRSRPFDDGSPLMIEAVEKGFALVIDGKFVPLVTANQELMMMFDT